MLEAGTILPSFRNLLSYQTFFSKTLVKAKEAALSRCTRNDNQSMFLREAGRYRPRRNWSVIPLVWRTGTGERRDYSSFDRSENILLERPGRVQIAQVPQFEAGAQKYPSTARRIRPPHKVPVSEANSAALLLEGPEAVSRESI